jgi:HEAT repeat protein
VARSKSESKEIRQAATFALREIGPAAIPALSELVKDQDEHVRSNAISALGKFGQ